MSEISKSIFAASLIRIHLVFTRALKVILEYGQVFAQHGFTDELTHLEFVYYVQSFLSLLHGHHVTEDELMFPYFRDKMPDKNFNSLT